MREIILLFLFIPTLAFGTGAVDSQNNYKDADERYADIQKSCLDKLEYTNKCMLVQDEQFIDPSTARKVQSELAEGLLSNIGRHYSYHSRQLFNEAEAKKRERILAKYRGVKARAKTLVKNKKLLPCQKACVAVCISSKLLDYDPSTFNHICVRRTMDGAIETQTGVCRNYAQIGDDLMEAFGLDTKKVYGDDHAMNLVKLDGIWYQIEPQDDSCTFYYNDGDRIKKKAGMVNMIKDSPTRQEGKDVSIGSGAAAIGAGAAASKEK